MASGGYEDHAHQQQATAECDKRRFDESGAFIGMWSGLAAAELTQHAGAQSCNLLGSVRGPRCHNVEQMVDAKSWRCGQFGISHARCRLGNDGYVCAGCTPDYRDRGEGRERRAASQRGGRRNITTLMPATTDVAVVDACAWSARLCDLLRDGGIREQVRTAIAQGKGVRVAA
jgi:hypothetical protein